MKVILIWPDEDLPAAKVLVNPYSRQRSEIIRSLGNAKAMLAKRGFEFQYGWKRNLSDTYFETVATLKG